VSELLRESDSGAYRFADPRPNLRLRRFTVFAFYPFDPGALALDIDALYAVAKNGDGSIEEIDTDATSEDQAIEIAKAALKAGYEDGWAILGAEERVGWYL
jgi:hypothetical protein